VTLPLRVIRLLLSKGCVCVYYCRTYYKAVRVWGGELLGSPYLQYGTL